MISAMTAGQGASGVEIKLGLEDDLRLTGVELYDEAFAAKLSAMIPDQGLRRQVLMEAADAGRCLTARSPGGLLGICGFHHAGRSFTGQLSAGLLFRRLGILGGLRACVVGTMMIRKPEEGELLMDGIAVMRQARGQGIGGRLIATLAEFARKEGYSRIRLDVIDTNPRARALYERSGFVETARRETGGLTRTMGFGAVTTMHLELQPK
jgi:ribosomal protein S18 acetylase RimI-like enzyme